MTDKFKVEFMERIDQKTQEKIYYNIRKAQVTNDPELFKKLTNNIWEFRTLYNKTYYRLFAFWDKTSTQNTLVISTHGLIKKTSKTPPGEMAKAERIRQEYFKQKK